LHDLYGYERVSFADQLRTFIYNQDLWTPFGIRVNDVIDSEGWDFAKEADSWIRGIQLTTGTEAGRALDPDLWVNAAFRHAPEGEFIVCTDMRFPNEYAKIKEYGGQVWRIERPGNVGVPHISDTALDGYEFDATIYNDGTVRDLAEKVIRMLDPVQAVYT
jgi:hypothetical protein